MDAQVIFNQIKKIIKVDENYVAPNFQTIGGVWTVWTWKNGDIMYQMMDEGYTGRIIAPGLDVMDTYIREESDWGIKFNKGNIEELNNVLKKLEVV